MKTRWMTKWSRMAAAITVPFLALLIASPAALGASLGVTAEKIEVIEQNDIADAQVSLTVTNHESILASDVYVVFEDGLEVLVGDIAPGGSATSGPVTQTIDYSEFPTRHFPVPVTLTFFLDDVFEELPTTVVVNLGSPSGE